MRRAVPISPPRPHGSWCFIEGFIVGGSGFIEGFIVGVSVPITMMNAPEPPLPTTPLEVAAHMIAATKACAEASDSPLAAYALLTAEIHLLFYRLAKEDAPVPPPEPYAVGIA